MMQHLGRWISSTFFILSVSLLGVVMFDEQAGPIVFSCLQPWLAICVAITPDAWQTQRNIPLGLIFLFSGMTVYSILGGFACVMIWAAVRRWKNRATT